MNGIVWLASYPKSGSTWLRVFLTNYLSKGSHPADINRLLVPNFSDPKMWDDALGWNSSDFTEETLSSARFSVQEAIGKRESIILKTHESFCDSISNRPLFSPAATRCAIYIIRNPLDVALSFANHLNQSVDFVIKTMARADCRMSAGTQFEKQQLPQSLGSWSWHVRSWSEAKGVRIHLLKYEDILREPVRAFTDTCAFMGLPIDVQKIKSAIEFSTFETLRAQEEATGFRERQPKCQSFFHRGCSGSWRDGLTGEQVKALRKGHSAVMRQFGYDLD